MFLKELTELAGVSGCEYEVRNYIKDILTRMGCDYYVDKLGNIIAHNKGRKQKTIMVAAHMDEVGLIVSGIDSDGFIKFEAVGGIDPRVLNSKAALYLLLIRQPLPRRKNRYILKLMFSLPTYFFKL
jgi:putative aminopeptidase FrvX